MNQIGIEPDLISAVGNGGKEGYVLSDDLNDPGADTLDGATAYNNIQEKSIPLYDQDGTTIIGTYTISNSAY